MDQAVVERGCALNLRLAGDVTDIHRIGAKSLDGIGITGQGSRICSSLAGLRIGFLEEPLCQILKIKKFAARTHANLLLDLRQFYHRHISLAEVSVLS